MVPFPLFLVFVKIQTIVFCPGYSSAVRRAEASQSDDGVQGCINSLPVGPPGCVHGAAGSDKEIWEDDGDSHPICDPFAVPLRQSRFHAWELDS